MTFLIVIASFVIFWGLVGICVRPLRSEHVTGLAFQGGIAGVEAAVAWWLASFRPDSFLWRYLLDGVIGICAIACLIQIVTVARLARRLVRRKKKINSSDLAAGLLFLAVRPDFRDRDWIKLQGENLAQECFVFERATLRLTATWLAASESLQLPERFAVNSKYEMLMRDFSPGIVKNCDPYIEAYESVSPGDLKSAAVAVGLVFSRRCCGQVTKRLLDFAYVSFLATYEAQRRTLQSYEVTPD